MTILKVIAIDDDKEGILRKIADKVDISEIEGLQQLIDDMIETMFHFDAIGLAAPQVGVSKQIFVLRDGTVCINPEAKLGSGKITSYSEACLSVNNGNYYDVKRIRNVIVHCLDRHGTQQRLAPRKKIYSIAIQHEMDHLNGRLICDKGKQRG